MSIDFLVAATIVALIPGTGVIYTVSCAIAGGWTKGWLAAVGGTLGVVPHVLAALLGLSGVMQAGATAFEVVRWAGVAYLVFLGISLLRSGARLDLDGADDESERGVVVVRRAVLMNLLNPKLTVFFFAFLPQFLDGAPSGLDPQLLGLAAAFMAITFVVFLGYARGAAAVRSHVLTRPSVRAWIERSLGGLLLLFAARLAVSDR
jgi:threonine/homoserine/homoserine lactone efflux protein